MDRVAPDVNDTAWGHKYFSLLFPERLDDYHVANYQRFHLIKLLEKPPEGEGRYRCAGRFIAAARELGILPVQLTRLLNSRDGEPHRYWRVGTSDGKHPRRWWSAMREGGFVAVGWPEIGDLSDIGPDKEGKESLRERMAAGNPGTPQSVGREVQQLFNFIASVKENDLVLAADGATTLGIARVAGPYSYEPGSECPHRREVEWLSLDEWEKPQREGLRTTLYQLRKPETQVTVEREFLASRAMHPRVGVATGQRHSQPLSGIPRHIQLVLERKRQVILYGPPGTGKTYWARRAALDLASLAAFDRLFEQLPPSEQAVITGEEQDHRGLVRMCTFHPAYGYEDFLEGYRPLTADGQLTFERRDGIFKRLCDDARSEPSRRFLLVIDEINRGDIPRIFGELLTVLERDKRGQADPAAAL